MTSHSEIDTLRIKARHAELAESLLPSGPLKHFVDGEWITGRGDDTFQSIDPTTGESLVGVYEGTKEEVNRAVDAAWEAYEQRWSETTPAERQQLLLTMADRLEARAEDFALIEVLDNGKPITEAREDIELAVDHFRYFAGAARNIEGKTVPHKELHIQTRREPYGVVGQVVPWNFPLLLATWKLAPALAAGNTVVLKPAEQTPISLLTYMREIADVLPDGVVNVVTGFGPETGAPLVSHERVPKVAFTGSTEVGQGVMKAAANTISDITLELGGKSPLIVAPDADPAEAADIAVDAMFFNGGECCSAGTRLFIHESIADEFVDAFLDAVGQLQMGDPLEESTDIGPQVSRAEVEKTLHYIGLARDSDASILRGGGTVEEGILAEGCFVEPTVIADVGADSTVATQEIFGPVEIMLEWDGYDEMVARANNVDYGLAAGVVTDDLSFAHRIAEDIMAGNIWVNTFNRLPAGQPFGGYKQSGIGREGAMETLREYTQTKSITMDLGDGQ
ncbi:MULTISPECIES: aldehyde dehydrogenase [Haloarcula]|uniref:aldehyde dehydrogenase family protein n=1 Tax=Haloarcula TaxID=2237 RepID=UPI000F8EDE03|nr:MULTISPECIES: aldehyde dehydrogenase family protein [Haloarcula]NHX41599.1 aldehyde dehydrogenase family protein [Haloarcula sp. R1-2]